MLYNDQTLGHNTKLIHNHLYYEMLVAPCSGLGMMPRQFLIGSRFAVTLARNLCWLGARGDVVLHVITHVTWCGIISCHVTRYSCIHVSIRVRVYIYMYMYMHVHI